MSLKSALYYWVECDSCGERADYCGGEISAYQDSDQAVDAVREMDWTTDGEKDHCTNCPALTRCEECGKPAGELAGERDYLCEACWAKAAEAS